MAVLDLQDPLSGKRRTLENSPGDEYITAGGDVTDFEADWPELRRRLIAERIEENRRRVARPAV